MVNIWMVIDDNFLLRSMGVPQARWMVLGQGNILLKWMMTRCTPNQLNMRMNYSMGFIDDLCMICV